MLNHKGTVTLETPRLILRKFEMSDANDMFKNWASDDEVSKFLSWSTHKDIDETKQILSKWISQSSNPDYYNWIITSKDTHEGIGGISVESINSKNSSCELGYNLSASYWNNGVMTEALKAVIKFLFTDIGFNRIQCKHDPMNIASGQVMIKSGMSYEGTLRQNFFANGRFHDSKLYAILKEDFKL